MRWGGGGGKASKYDSYTVSTKCDRLPYVDPFNLKLVDILNPILLSYILLRKCNDAQQCDGVKYLLVKEVRFVIEFVHDI